MKCIKCNAENNLIDRNINLDRCRICSHQFVFEPTEMPVKARLTDTFFEKLMIDLSVNKTLFFTPRQLYYLLERRLRTRSTKSLTANLISYLGGGVLCILIASIMCKGVLELPFDRTIPILAILYATWVIYQLSQNSISNRFNRRIRNNNLLTIKIIALLAVLTSSVMSVKNSAIEGIISSIIFDVSVTFTYSNLQFQQSNIFDILSIEYSQFDRWLARWKSMNNQPEKLLSIPDENSLPAAPNLEVIAYSFDRVVICDTPEIAQLLISNNFHFENNCAILTIDGYPQNIFTTTMEMLRRNLDLKVYALHNCSPAGIQLVSRLRQDENWFPNLAIPIIDVGILPRQIIDNLDILTLQSTASAELARQLPPDVRNILNQNELAWLDAGCYLELEFFSPQKLIRILQRAINESRELAVIEGDGMVVVDNLNFYTVDSFG